MTARHTTREIAAIIAPLLRARPEDVTGYVIVADIGGKLAVLSNAADMETQVAVLRDVISHLAGAPAPACATPVPSGACGHSEPLHDISARTGRRTACGFTGPGGKCCPCRVYTPGGGDGT